MADEHVGFNGRFAAALTRTVGSMWVVYFTTLFVLAWIALATFGPLHTHDPYPFPFLLFIGNVVQLLLVFVILAVSRSWAAPPTRVRCRPMRTLRRFSQGSCRSTITWWSRIAF